MLCQTEDTHGTPLGILLSQLLAEIDHCTLQATITFNYYKTMHPNGQIPAYEGFSM
jgi:hypothetical protein